MNSFNTFLKSNKITRDGGVSLCQALYKQCFLTHLNLSCCAIQDEGAEAVHMMLTHNRTLQTLFLDHNRIASRGLRNIAEALLTKNRTLQCLTLWGNFWDEHACREFAPLLGGPRNIDKENVGGMGGLQRRDTLRGGGGGGAAAAAGTHSTRLQPELVDFCFYTVEQKLIVCQNEAMHNKDFSCAIELNQ
ncbi:hypothetical protein BDR26DRAFT_330615 [Obelidium mucronatum]|nr:hypothetical protein BDR26DRAFT_330615 [Obelidium mucronatum]